MLWSHIRYWRISIPCRENLVYFDRFIKTMLNYLHVYNKKYLHVGNLSYYFTSLFIKKVGVTTDCLCRSRFDTFGFFPTLTVVCSGPQTDHLTQGFRDDTLHRPT